MSYPIYSETPIFSFEIYNVFLVLFEDGVSMITDSKDELIKKEIHYPFDKYPQFKDQSLEELTEVFVDAMMSTEDLFEVFYNNNKDLLQITDPRYYDGEEDYEDYWVEDYEDYWDREVEHLNDWVLDECPNED